MKKDLIDAWAFPRTGQAKAGEIHGEDVLRPLLVDLPGTLQAAAVKGTEKIQEGVRGDIDGVTRATVATITDGGRGLLAISRSNSDGLVAKRVSGLVETVAGESADVVPEFLGDGHNVGSVVLAHVWVATSA